jgi:hypothetical protein
MYAHISNMQILSVVKIVYQKKLRNFNNTKKPSFLNSAT